MKANFSCLRKAFRFVPGKLLGALCAECGRTGQPIEVVVERLLGAALGCQPEPILRRVNFGITEIRPQRKAVHDDCLN